MRWRCCKGSKFDDYGTLTVLINGDEEISSPGSRSTITRFAAEQDAVFSFEGGGRTARLRLATSGIGSAYLTVRRQGLARGLARRSGASMRCMNSSHQMLQMSDLSKPEQGL